MHRPSPFEPRPRRVLPIYVVIIILVVSYLWMSDSDYRAARTEECRAKNQKYHANTDKCYGVLK